VVVGAEDVVPGAFASRPFVALMMGVFVGSGGSFSSRRRVVEEVAGCGVPWREDEERSSRFVGYCRSVNNRVRHGRKFLRGKLATGLLHLLKSISL